MARYCVYCGKQIRKSDKFCIFCGKPLLSNLTKTDETSSTNVFEEIREVSPKKIRKGKKEKKLKKGEVEEITEVKKEIEEETIEAKEDKKKKKEKKKEKEKVEAEEVIKIKEKEVKPLPEGVKEQIELYLELTDIQLKKKTVADKLTDLQKLVKSTRYETDYKYDENINIQLKALKTIINELKQKEDEIKQKMETPFIIEKLNVGIETKRSQLKNLTREYKLKKIKDKAVFNKLKERYKKEKEELEAEREELIAGIKLWIEDLNIEKVEITTEKNFNKGRFSAKEISEEEFKEKDIVFEKKLNQLKSKIATLENLIKKKIRE